MEGARKLVEREQQTELDIRSTVTAFRYDIDNFGNILRETKQAEADNHLSYFAEGFGRGRTEFAIPRIDGQLVRWKEGRWRPYMDMLDDGIEAEAAKAKTDPRRQFLYDWTQNDHFWGEKMNQLRPGEKVSWIVAYPHDEARKYGPDFMSEAGLHPDRQMGFLYQASCRTDGWVTLESQMIDRSDPDALKTVQKEIFTNPKANIVDLTRVYDEALFNKFNQLFYAGRLGEEVSEDFWGTMNAQADLIDYLVEGFEEIAWSDLEGEALDESTKLHIYGVWALFKKRLDGTAPMYTRSSVEDRSTNSDPSLRIQAEQATQEFLAKGLVIPPACGGQMQSLQTEADLLNAKSEDVFRAMFGEADETYRFDRLMFCNGCQKPPEDGDSEKMCGPCGYCKTCDYKMKSAALKTAA